MESRSRMHCLCFRFNFLCYAILFPIQKMRYFLSEPRIDQVIKAIHACDTFLFYTVINICWMDLMRFKSKRCVEKQMSLKLGISVLWFVYLGSFWDDDSYCFAWKTSFIYVIIKKTFCAMVVLNLCPIVYWLWWVNRFVLHCLPWWNIAIWILFFMLKECH